MNELSETELYKELGNLTKNRDQWKESIPYVSSLLTHDSVKIKAKALWLPREISETDNHRVVRIHCLSAISQIL